MNIEFNDLKVASESCASTKEVLSSFGYSDSPCNYRSIKKIASEYGIPLPVYRRKFQSSIYTFEEIFKENSTYSARQRMRSMLISAGYLKDECSFCGIPPVWKNKPLTLQLDHINGVGDDNRIENLRLLCPNCHSQTETFCGKKSSIPKNKDKCSCGNLKLTTSKNCRKCSTRSYKPPEKIVWPSDEELIDLIKATNFSKTAKNLGVSDNSIRKRLKSKGYNPKTLSRDGGN